MNVYDEAHSLANAIKQSDEYIKFKETEEEIKKNPEVEKMVKDFQAKSFEMQLKQMSGETLTEEDTVNMQRLYAIVIQDPNAQAYLQTNMRFSLMMEDVYKIISEAAGTQL